MSNMILKLLTYTNSFNLVNLMFYAYSLSIIIFEVFTYCDRDLLKNILINNAYMYGKLSRDTSSYYLKFITVPKRWFLHFYITSLVLSILCWFLVVHVCIRKKTTPSVIEFVLNFFTLSDRTTAVGPTLSYIALMLFTLHVWKRLYENMFVSIFSNRKMSIFHYFVGITHYTGAFIGLISFFPELSSSGTDGKNWDKIKYWHLLVISITLFASSSQFYVLEHLASLRKIKGEDANEEYYLPFDGLFTYVSCPHFLMEIIVYFGIGGLMSFKNPTWNAVCLFVLINQVQVALMTHRWYKKKFKDYPKNRKAILPFLL